MIAVFTEYYKNYKGSSLEAEYDTDTQLTTEENEEHKEDVRRAKEEQEQTQKNQVQEKSDDLLANLLLFSVLRQLDREKPVINNLDVDNDAPCIIM